VALLVLAGAAVVVAWCVTAGVPWTFVYAVGAIMSPSTISWDSKAAWVKCAGAIADAEAWPSALGQRCEAMHMCANEATLSSAELGRLARAIRNTPGCPEL